MQRSAWLSRLSRLSRKWMPFWLALIAGAASAQPAPLGVAAPASGEVCPSIDEDYLLCNGDLMSGNCADFVAAAGALAQLYESELAQHPDWEAELDDTLWWGCGSAKLSDIRNLLARIGTPPAEALLRSEPYQSLPEPHRKASPPPRPVVIDCANVAPAERSECAAQELAAAEAAYERAFATCQAAVAGPLRSELVAGEKAWNATRGVECDGAEGEYQDPSLRAYARSQCLAESTRQRTKGMLAAHPECARAK